MDITRNGTSAAPAREPGDATLAGPRAQFLDHVTGYLRSLFGEFPEANAPTDVLVALPAHCRAANHGADVHPTAVLMGEVYLGPGARVGPFALLRGPVVVGEGVLVGSRCEVARSIVMPRSTLGHSCTVLDSIVGEDAALAGELTTANLRVDRGPIAVTYRSSVYRYEGKFGCTIESRTRLPARCLVMPGTYIPADTTFSMARVVYGHARRRR